MRGTRQVAQPSYALLVSLPQSHVVDLQRAPAMCWCDLTLPTYSVRLLTGSRTAHDMAAPSQGPPPQQLAKRTCRQLSSAASCRA
jgi:hypothetical protein